MSCARIVSLSGTPCDAKRLYAMEHRVSRDEALRALEEPATRAVYVAKQQHLERELRDANEQIRALQIVAQERNMPDAQCTGFYKNY